MIDEITVVGSRCGPFVPALKALHEGKIHVEPLIEGTYQLDEALVAFERATSQPTLKLLLKP